MNNSLLRQIVLLPLTIFIITIISFSILMREPLNHFLIEKSIFDGYLTYLKNLFHANLGISYLSGEQLYAQVKNITPATLQLSFFALLLATIIGYPLGLLSSAYKKTIASKFINFISLLGISIPIFWITPLVLYFSSKYNLDIATVGQYNLLYQIPKVTGIEIIDIWFIQDSERYTIIMNVLNHLILPTLVLALAPTMEIIRITKNNCDFVTAQEYTKAVYTFGWSRSKIWRNIILKNTFAPLIPALSRLFILSLTYCLLIEDVFSWPGIGSFMVNAFNQQDYNTISAGILIICTLAVLVNFIAQIVMFLLDPLHKKTWYAK